MFNNNDNVYTFCPSGASPGESPGSPFWPWNRFKKKTKQLHSLLWVNDDKELLQHKVNTCHPGTSPGNRRVALIAAPIYSIRDFSCRWVWWLYLYKPKVYLCLRGLLGLGQASENWWRMFAYILFPFQALGLQSQLPAFVHNSQRVDHWVQVHKEHLVQNCGFSRASDNRFDLFHTFF